MSDPQVEAQGQAPVEPNSAMIAALEALLAQARAGTLDTKSAKSELDKTVGELTRAAREATHAERKKIQEALLNKITVQCGGDIRSFSQEAVKAGLTGFVVLYQADGNVEIKLSGSVKAPATKSVASADGGNQVHSAAGTGSNPCDDETFERLVSASIREDANQILEADIAQALAKGNYGGDAKEARNTKGWAHKRKLLKAIYTSWDASTAVQSDEDQAAKYQAWKTK